MRASRRRKLKGGLQYNDFFPRPNYGEHTVHNFIEVDTTVDLIKLVVKRTLDDTKRIAQVLKGSTVEETCRNIWSFVYDHIQYTPDATGKEQIRRPARLWWERGAGGDCDCYTTFISSILTNLKITHVLRITKYNGKRYFQHIYPVVPVQNGYITIDCVCDAFNVEVPYSEKKDYLNQL